MPYRADGYQASVGFVLDSTLYDGNTATGYQRNGASGGNVAITGKIDLGSSPTATKYLKAFVRWSSTFSYIWESSNDGISWSANSMSLNTSLVNRNCTYAGQLLQWMLVTADSVRYWRLSVRDTDTDACGSCNIGLMEMEALSASLVHISETAPAGSPYTEEVTTLVAGRGVADHSWEPATVEPPGFGAGRGSVLSDAQYLDAPQGKGAGIASLYEELNLLFAVGGGAASVVDVLSVAEYPFAIGAGRGQASVAGAAPIQVLAELGRAYGAASADVVLVRQDGLDTPASLVAGYATATSLLESLDAPQGIGGGKGAVVAGVGITASVQGIGGGKGATVSLALFRETAPSNGAGTGSLTSVHTPTETPQGKGAGIGSLTFLLTAADDTPQGKGGGRAANIATQTFTEAVQGKGGGNVATSGVARYANPVQAKVAGQGSQTLERVITDIAQARGGGKGALTTGSATYTDTVSAKGAGRIARVCIPMLESDFIRALRQAIVTALPSLNDVPEGMPLIPFQPQTSLPLPYCCIVVQPPVQDTNTAVFTQAHWVPVDIVIAQKMVRSDLTDDVTVDSTQDLRKMLDYLAACLMADPFLMNGGEAHISNDAQIQATPLDRMNEYQMKFAQMQEEVTCLVLTMVYRLLTDYSGDCG